MSALALAAKLTPPPPREGLVPRARLAAWLAAQARARLTLVVAPAGFGKTTLLAQWAAECGAGLAWLALDERDNDPTRFWAYVAAALDTVAPGAGDHARSMLQSPAPPPAEVVIVALLDELERLEREVVLLLDDYHLIAAEAIHAGVAFLVDHLPPGVRVVIAGRGDPPLPLARWRLRGQLAELRVGELRFTPGEVAALAAAAGLSLGPAEAEALASRTEGWAGALALAARSLRDSDDPQARIAAFAGAQRHLYDYLADEVLSRQPAHVQRFLLDTSVLDQLCAELCDALRDEGPAPSVASSQVLLEQLEAQGLFLLPLDEERRWYRYHALFAEFLRERLRREGARRAAALHRRAAGWYARQAMPAEAVAHLLAAGDTEQAAAIVEREGRPLLLRSEVATVLGWLAALPAELVRARPGLCLIEAWAAAIAGHFEAVEAPLAAVEATLAAYAGDPDAPAPFSRPYTPRNLASEALAVRATVAGLRRETARTVELGRSALAALPDDSVLVRAVVALMLGNAAYLQGDLASAAPALEDAARAGQAGGMPIIAIFALRQLAELHARAGQLHRAARTYEDAIARGAALYPRREGAPPRPVPVAGAAYVGLGMLRYEWGELDAAEALLRDGLRLGRQGENVEILLMGPIGLARVQLARGQADAARATMAQAVAYARRTGVPRLADWLGAEQARLDLALGDVASAAAWDQERRLDPAGHLSYLEELDYLALALLRAAQSRGPEALRLLARLRGLAEAQGRGGSLVEIFALTALAARASGDPAGAQAALARALAMAAPEGYLRTFVDLGPPMRELLAARLAGPEPPGDAERASIGRLLAAFPSEPNVGAVASKAPVRPAALGPQPSALIEPPTPRELEVLGWIGEGLRNEEIAEQLVVGLATVKKHINNLYAKLEVSSRTQALKRARELGLIE
ncbi:MAG TPA: LuxR C-terminal-related transcriptional regulator [Chloroflexaceae bacterium]|nr:LuxR C-terminal-related transcriptional regulator [Chloroflexaceae bacterium]